MNRRLLRFRSGSSLLFRLRCSRRGFGTLCLAAAVFQKNVRAHRRFFSAGRLLFCLLRQRRIVNRKIKLAHAGGTALLCALHMLNVLVCNGINDHLRRILVLALRLGIFHARTVFDGCHDARYRHIETCNQTQQHADDHNRYRADAADERFKQACKSARQHAACRSVDTAVPKSGNNAPVPRRVKFSADQLHQTADECGRQKRTRHAQRDRSAVVQKQNQKTHDE